LRWSRVGAWGVADTPARDIAQGVRECEHPIVTVIDTGIRDGEHAKTPSSTPRQ